jgi:hypothetical protein
MLRRPLREHSMKTLPEKAATTAQPDHGGLDFDSLIGRLCSANEAVIVDLLDRFSDDERANLAMFCYRKAHLHHAGLMIAATCDLSTLVQAFGTLIGETIYAQSREQPRQQSPFLGHHRSKISLANFCEIDGNAFARPIANEDIDESDVG